LFSTFDVEQAEYRAFTERITCHTAGLLMHGGRGVGTGILIAYGDKKIVLTAEHNLRDASIDDICFFLKPSGTMQEASMKDVMPQRFNTGSRLRFKGAAASDPKNDIAALVLEDGETLTGAAAFYVLDNRLEGLELTEDASVIVLGYPAANSREIAPRVRALGPATDHCHYDSATNHLPGLPSSFDPDDQFLLQYNRMSEICSPRVSAVGAAG
jgi:hypothetical protein